MNAPSTIAANGLYHGHSWLFDDDLVSVLLAIAIASCGTGSLLFPADTNAKLQSSSPTKSLSWRTKDMNKKHLFLGVAVVVVFFIGFSVLQRVSPTFLAH